MRMPQIFHVHCHPGQGWRSRKRSVNALSRRHSPSLSLENVNRNGNVRRSMIIYQHSLRCGLWTFARTSSEANFARHKINDVKISRMLLELKFGWGTRGCGWIWRREENIQIEIFFVFPISTLRTCYMLAGLAATEPRAPRAREKLISDSLFDDQQN